MTDTVIEIKDLSKRFDGVAAVQAVSFTVPRGRHRGAARRQRRRQDDDPVDPARACCCRPPARSRVLGEDMLRHRYRVLPRINFSSPYVDLPHRLTVRQNLTIYARLYGVARHARAHRARWPPICRSRRFLDRPAGKLSSGQKTRVALAKALLNEPELLLLDEPTASLDPDTGDWVRGYLEDYRARTGATILLASHNMGEVERLCSEVMMMKAGPHRRPRQPRRADRPLRPRQSRRGVPAHRPRTAEFAPEPVS